MQATPAGVAHEKGVRSSALLPRGPHGRVILFRVPEKVFGPRKTGRQEDQVSRLQSRADRPRRGCRSRGQRRADPAAGSGASKSLVRRTLPPDPGAAGKQPTLVDAPSKSHPSEAGECPDGSHDASLTDFLAPPQADDELGRLGKYRILKILGHGGMGVVYQAEDPQLKRTVALKAMLPALAASASAGKRFLREARRWPPSNTITSSASTRSMKTAAFPSWPWSSSRANRSTSA